MRVGWDRTRPSSDEPAVDQGDGRAQLGAFDAKEAGYVPWHVDVCGQAGFGRRAVLDDLDDLRAVRGGVIADLNPQRGMRGGSAADELVGDAFGLVDRNRETQTDRTALGIR